MPIEPEATPAFPPARDKPPPAVMVAALLAINTVYLNAAASPAALRHFYTRVLGMAAVGGAEGLEFRHGLRHIILGPARPGVPFTRLALSVTGFDDMLHALGQHRIHYEVLHYDAGLCRAAILQDPAGNWIHLLETRPL